MKSRDSLKSLEADLLKTAAKEAKHVGKTNTLLSSAYRDQDEKKLRDKLVSKLQEKEEQRVKHLEKQLEYAHTQRNDFTTAWNKMPSGWAWDEAGDKDFQAQVELVIYTKAFVRTSVIDTLPFLFRATLDLKVWKTYLMLVRKKT